MQNLCLTGEPNSPAGSTPTTPWGAANEMSLFVFIDGELLDSGGNDDLQGQQQQQKLSLLSWSLWGGQEYFFHRLLRPPTSDLFTVGGLSNEAHFTV